MAKKTVVDLMTGAQVAEVINDNSTELYTEKDIVKKLEQSAPTGTESTPTYTGDVLTQIVWENTSAETVRTDVFTYSEDVGAVTETTTQVRTLATGETLTIVTVFNTADGRILSNTSTLNLYP